MEEDSDTSSYSIRSQEESDDSSNSTPDPDLHVLVLGEAGAGKTTLINGFITCAYIQTLEEVKTKDVPVPINSPNFESPETVSVNFPLKISVLQFEFENTKPNLHLIDTPPICNSKKIFESNCEAISAYAREIRKVHAYILVLKPDISAMKNIEISFFKIISLLNPSALRKIMFVITSCRCKDQIPTEVKKFVEIIMDKINISFFQFNTKYVANFFNFDNSIPQYIDAIKGNKETVPENKISLDISWYRFRKQYAKLIIALKVDEPPTESEEERNYTTPNDMIDVIFQFTHPLVDVLQLVIHNFYLAHKHRMKITSMKHQSVHSIKKLVVIPQIQLILIPISKPRTICINTKCVQLYQTGLKDVLKYRFATCHTPCCLTNTTGLSSVGDCSGFLNKETCLTCGCPYYDHSHVYYLTKITNDPNVYPTDVKELTNRRKALEAYEDLLINLELRERKLDRELREILKIMAYMGTFLKRYTSFHIPFVNYFKQLIQSERYAGEPSNMNAVNVLQTISRRFETAMRKSRPYYWERDILDKSYYKLNPNQANLNFRTLFKLEITGELLDNMMKVQYHPKEWEFCESYRLYMYPPVANIHFSEMDKSNQNQDDKENQDVRNKKHKIRKTIITLRGMSTRMNNVLSVIQPSNTSDFSIVHLAIQALNLPEEEETSTS